MEYRRHYDIRLLDDIHNYFPAILYEPGAFHSVQDLLTYIQAQVRNRFDLFTSAQRNHVPQYTARAVEADIIALLRGVLSTAGTGHMALLTQPPQQTMPRGFADPVPIRPTAREIDEGTSVEVVDSTEDICAICQDAMQLGATARSINHCDHRFHTGCIDTWFQTNVHCPVCRHDIRDHIVD